MVLLSRLAVIIGWDRFKFTKTGLIFFLGKCLDNNIDNKKDVILSVFS